MGGGKGAMLKLSTASCVCASSVARIKKRNGCVVRLWRTPLLAAGCGAPSCAWCSHSTVMVARSRIVKLAALTRGTSSTHSVSIRTPPVTVAANRVAIPNVL